jgi:hypothetical protein
MDNRQVRYFFGRLNIVAQRSDIRGLLTDGLQREALVSHRGLQWGFFQLATISSGLGDFVHGFLVKYKSRTEEEVAVPETREIYDQTVENRIRAKARFFLHISSHVIAYRPFGREISRVVFANRFKELFEANLDRFFVDAEIFPIDEERRLHEAIRHFQRVSRVRVFLHPSNPSNRDIWKRVDQRLRSLEVASYREEYEADPKSRGLGLTEDREIASKIAMAEDGYGTVQIVGDADGEKRTVSTRDAPVIASAPQDDQPPEVVLERLSLTVKRILDRFTERSEE